MRHRKIGCLLGWDAGRDVGHRLGVNAALHMPTVDCIVTCGRDSTLRMWRSSECVHVCEAHADSVMSIAHLAALSDAFVTGSADHTVVLHTGIGGRRVESAIHTNAVRRVASFNGGASVLSASLDGTLVVHDPRADMRSTQQFFVGTPLYALAVTSDTASAGAATFLVGCARGNVFLLDSRMQAGDGIATSMRNAHTGCVRDAAMLANGTAATACADGTVKVWDLRATRYALHVALHVDAVFTLCAVPNTHTFLSGGRDGGILATNAATMVSALVASFEAPITHLALAHGATSLIVSTSLSTVDIYAMSELVSAEVVRGGVADDPTSTSPGRISFEEVDLPPALPWRHEEGRRYVAAVRAPPPPSPVVPPTTFTAAAAGDDVSAGCRTPEKTDAAPGGAFAAAEDLGNLWCSPLQPARRGRQRQCVPLPLHSLQGAVAAIDVVLLAGKRFALSWCDDGSAHLWDILALRRVRSWALVACAASLHALARQLAHDAYAPTWCQVSCRWGYVCVTLAAEDALAAGVGPWELQHEHATHVASPVGLPLSPLLGQLLADGTVTPGAAAAAGGAAATAATAAAAAAAAAALTVPSVCALTRRQRARLRAAIPINLGQVLIRRVFGLGPPKGQVLPGSSSIEEAVSTPNAGARSGGASFEHSAASSLEAIVDLTALPPITDAVGGASLLRHGSSGARSDARSDAGTAAVVVVWSSPAHYTTGDRSAVRRHAVDGIASGDARVPLWVHDVLRSSDPLQTTTPAATVTVEMVPLVGGTLATMPKPILSLRRDETLGAIAGEVVRQLGLRLPTLRASNTALRAQGLRPLAGDGDTTEGGGLSADSAVTAEEYVELLLADGSRPVDGMLTAAAAQALFRGRGGAGGSAGRSNALQLAYRIRPGLAI